MASVTSTAHVSQLFNHSQLTLCLATNLYDNQEMVCIGQLANACNAGQMTRPGDGMILADGVNLWVSSKLKFSFFY